MTTSFALVVYLFIYHYEVKIARYIIYLCITLGFWSFGYFFWQISINSEQALFWVRVLMSGAILTSISFLHLVIVLLNLYKIKFWKNLLIILYIPCIFWEVLNLTPFFVQGVEGKMFFEFWPIPGKWYLFFLILFILHVLIASFLLIYSYINSTGYIKAQRFLLLIGITITFIGGSTNYFLWYDINIPPWGNGLVSIYVFLTVYAIIKHNLLSLKIVAAEIFTFVILLLAFFNILYSKSLSEIILNSLIFLIISGIGFFIINTIKNEIKRNHQLRVLSKQKTEFISIASHQLKTPLTVISGYSEQILENKYGKVPQKIREVIMEIDESSDRLVQLANSFLNINKIEEGKIKYNFSECNINTIVYSVIEELQEPIGQKNIVVNFFEKEFGNSVSIDGEKIRHVIFNYIDNAIKYSDKGKIQVTLTKLNTGLCLRVFDEGYGFYPNDGVAFFNKFYRGDNIIGKNVNGTGLGLYVCKKFAEAHGGKVWAHSPGPGKGSEFGFWIPKKRTKQHMLSEKANKEGKQIVVNQYDREKPQS